MRYVVTGGFGYIGSVLCKRLKEEGHEVYVLDYDSCKDANKYCDNFFYTSYGENILNVRDFYEQADGIFHLGASSLLNLSLKNPLSYYDNNVGEFIKMLQIIKEVNPNCPLVFASSAAVYGESTSGVMSVADPKNPINPYGRTKLQCEQILTDVAKYERIIPSISFRFFNVVGAYGDVGQDIYSPLLLPSLCRGALDKREKIELFSNNRRDYIHVLDVCDGMIEGMKFLQNPKEYRRNPYVDSIIKQESNAGSVVSYYDYGLIPTNSNWVDAYKMNLGTGIGTNTYEVFEHFKRITKSDLSVIAANHRNGDPRQLVADISVTEEYLNWKPVHSSWYEMINSQWEYANRKKEK